MDKFLRKYSVALASAVLMVAAALAASCSSGPDKMGMRAPDEIVLLYLEGQEGTSSQEGSLGPLHSNGLTGPEVYTGGGFIENVGDSARLELYFPKNPNGQLLIVCPGGGYSSLNAWNTGTTAGSWLSDHGYTAAILKYRMPNGDMRLPVRDLTNSILYCRQKASSWNVDQIGVAGGSAGGHLAGYCAALPEVPEAKPDFAVLLYPLTTLLLPNTDNGILTRMFGEERDPTVLKEYSLELHASKDMPPVFIAANRHDWILTQEHFLGYYKALFDADADVEMHLYGEGYHGWGFSTKEYCDEATVDNREVWGLRDSLGTKYQDQMGLCRESFEKDLEVFLSRVAKMKEDNKSNNQ